MDNTKYYGTGRRKSSVARVYLVPGTGKITINKRDIDEYLGLETLKVIVRQPLVLTDNTDKFDVIVNVKGGGYSGQAGAIRHGIARALLQVDADFRPVLKSAGFLTRDPRMKETTLKEMLAKHPERVIEFAVKGMLPKGPLGRQMYTKLFVYAGPDHKHAAQKPETLEF